MTFRMAVGVASSITKSANRPFQRSPFRGIRPKRSMRWPAMVSASSRGKRDAELLLDVVQLEAALENVRPVARRPRSPAFPRRTRPGSRPRSSSIAFSMVARPAVPPCSSTTMAMWVWRRRISRKRSSARLNSGTRKGGSQILRRARRSSPPRPTGRRGPWRGGSRRRCRAFPGRPAGGRTCAPGGRSLTSSKLAVSGIATIFVRGTMMSRTVLSPNSMTLWRSCRSSRWMTPSSAPRLKTLLSSSSVRPGRCSGIPKRRSTAGRELDAELGDGREELGHPGQRNRHRARDGDGRGGADRLRHHLGEDEERHGREEDREENGGAVP